MVGGKDHILLVSREPHRRLMESIGIDGMEVHWLTERESAMAISPDLESLEALFTSRFSNHRGIASFEGIEWMFDLHGSRQVLSMLSRLVDSIDSTQWTLFLPIDSNAIEEQDFIRLTRECPTFVLAEEDDEIIEHTEHNEQQMLEEIREDYAETTVEDGSPRLVMLTRLSREGFTSGILRRRILQWRRMGLDVSALEPALNMQNIADAWELYQLVEEDVRTAVELDRRIDLLSESGQKSTALKFRFRVRLLNNLQLVGKELEEEIISLNL